MSRAATSYAQWFVNEVSRAARAAHARMMRGETELYLYFKRGELRFEADKPEGFELGTPERAPTHLTADQLVGWTHARSTRLACLPNEET